MDERYVGYDGAGQLTGISKATLSAMVHARRIPHVRIGPRFVRFRVAELLQWLEEHHVTATGKR